MTREEMEELKGLAASMGLYDDKNPCKKAVIIGKAIKALEQEPKWIPVSERLPEPRVDVWVNSDIGQTQGYYEEHVGTWYASFGQGRDYLELIVNAWMPLPKSYKAESEEV